MPICSRCGHGYATGERCVGCGPYLRRSVCHAVVAWGLSLALLAGFVLLMPKSGQQGRDNVLVFAVTVAAFIASFASIWLLRWLLTGNEPMLPPNSTRAYLLSSVSFVVHFAALRLVASWILRALGED